MCRRQLYVAASVLRNAALEVDGTDDVSPPIPNANCGQVQFALTVAALEDKIVQYAVVTILNQIYEEDFLGFSYGFRPGRSQHQALDALSWALVKKKVNYVLDADIQSFFDNLDKAWVIRFIEQRCTAQYR